MSAGLREILRLFLLLGATAFGGPVAHIALMRHEFVRRRAWLSDEKFAELIGLTNLIPGPNSTEMAIHLGYQRAGWRGCLVSGAGFILPAVVITLVVAWLYGKFGKLPDVQALLLGVKPAIIALIVVAVLPLARTILNTIPKFSMGAAAFVLCLFGFNEILAMFAVGLAMLAYEFLLNVHRARLSAHCLVLLFAPGLQLIAPQNLQLFGIFLKIGAILYGSGYVLFAFLDSELVGGGYMTRAQLIDAIAVGQITPGPVFSSVALIGYQIGGLATAVVSTLAIFLPSFVFVLATHRILPRLKKSGAFSAFLSGVNAASMAIIAYALIGMARTAFIHWSSYAIGAAALSALLVFRKLNSTYVILAAAAAGFIAARSGVSVP